MIRFEIEIESNRQEYVNEKARVRGISVGELLRRVLCDIVHDKYIDQVLDDDHVVPVTSTKPAFVVNAAFGSDKTKNHPTRPYVARRKPLQLTKSELRDQLTQAVVNTGGTRLSLQDRKDALLARAKVRPFCPSDLGDSQELNKWWKALGELVAEHLLMKRPPAQHTRRVYYELRPTAVVSDQQSHVPVTDVVPPQSAPSAGDLVEAPPPEDERGVTMQGGFA